MQPDEEAEEVAFSLNAKNVKRILYAVVGLVFFWFAATTFMEVGLTMESAFPALLGVVLVLLAATGKG